MISIQAVRSLVTGVALIATTHSAVSGAAEPPCDPQESVAQCYDATAEQFCRTFGQARCAMLMCHPSQGSGADIFTYCNYATELLKRAAEQINSLPTSPDVDWYQREIFGYQRRAHTLLTSY